MFKKLRYLTMITILVLSAVLAAGCGSLEPNKPAENPQGNSEKAKVLRVGLVPNQSPDKVKTQYEPFRAYLVEKLGMEVELFVPVDYSAVVEAMANDKLDVAYFGGVTYVQASKRANIYPIVTEIDRETKTTKYHSVIIVPADSKVQKIEELKDKTFAFGDVNSTSGSPLGPRIPTISPLFMLTESPSKPVTPPGYFFVRLRAFITSMFSQPCLYFSKPKRVASCLTKS